jgi:NAD(P)-dependent dehydrogenase (short-subunit alcohol dehydrogenase family)
MPTVLVTGANRGIGLELARQYAAAGWQVIACCRRPRQAKTLSALAGDVEIRALDVASPASIARLAALLGRRPIDVLLNNAGIHGGRAGFGRTDPKEFLRVVQVNALAPLMLAEALLANVRRSGQKKIVAISSGMGSIAGGPGGGSYAYRASKAALNMVMANAAKDLAGKGVALAAISPGWVRTDMGGRQAPLAAAQSAAGIISVIAGLSTASSGSFFDWNGGILPW